MFYIKGFTMEISTPLKDILGIIVVCVAFISVIYGFAYSLLEAGDENLNKQKKVILKTARKMTLYITLLGIINSVPTIVKIVTSIVAD